MMKQQKSNKQPKYFQLYEFLESEMAVQKGIANLPCWEHAENLKALTTELLDPLRVAYGKPISVTSGFRGKELNEAVKGSAYSAHLLGYAADLVPVEGDVDEFIRFAVDWLKSNNIAFDQAVVEKDKNGNHWLHLALYNLEKLQRKQIKAIIKAE